MTEEYKTKKIHLLLDYFERMSNVFRLIIRWQKSVIIVSTSRLIEKIISKQQLIKSKEIYKA